VRTAPCGHCTWCQTKQATTLPPPRPAPDFSRLVDGTALVALSQKHPAALSLPRQQARFLCGLGSPAVTKAKLGRHALCGALEQWRFHDVLAWCEARAASSLR